MDNYNNQFSGNQNDLNNSFSYKNNSSVYNYDVNNIPEKKNSLAIAGFICALTGFLFNPLGLISILGFIFGLVGQNSSSDKTYKTFGLLAWIFAIISFLFQCIFDLEMTIFTMGIGIFFIFF